MSIRIAINGFGRIGRGVFRALFESGLNEEIALVAINDLADIDLNIHLAKFDSVHGKFPFELSLNGDCLSVENQKIVMLRESSLENLPWAELNVDVVLECTGFFTKPELAAKHIDSGAKKVIVSAPVAGADATIVCGVNDDTLKPEHNVISCGSCTTNCLSPVVKVLNDNLGVEQGMMTTVHAFTNDQKLHDSYHNDPYRARAATSSMIPTKTGAAQAIGLVLPELNGKLDGMAVRVPTANVSLVDLTVFTERETSVEEVNQLMKEASKKQPAILAYNELPLVSVDFNHNSASASFDAGQTKVDGKLVKVMAWYDNEWGFSNRMLDLTKLVFSSAA